MDLECNSGEIFGVPRGFLVIFLSCSCSNKKLLYKISLDSLVLKDGECLHLDIPKPPPPLTNARDVFFRGVSSV